MLMDSDAAVSRHSQYSNRDCRVVMERSGRITITSATTIYYARLAKPYAGVTQQ
jgi:hypothetical protein